MKLIKKKDFILCPIKISDAKGYLEAHQDKDTIRNMESVPANLKEAKEELKGNIKEIKEKDSEYYTIEIKGKYAGNATLQHQNWDINSDEGRIHILIHPNFRGKGLATKVIESLIDRGIEKKFSKIFIQCKAINKGIIKISKKLGFKKVKEFLNENKVKKILFVKKLR